MHNIRKYNQEAKATVCLSNNCVTVYGEAAQFIRGVAIAAAIISAVVLIEKAIR